MQKNNEKMAFNVKTMVYMALLVALHLILTRVLVIELGAYRISVGSVTTILAGMWLGPIAGGICGFAADIIGCFMKGYAINPLITVAAVCWGVVPVLLKPLYSNKNRKMKTIWIVVGITITAILSSLIFTTAGLVLIMGYNFYAIMPGRLVQFAIMTPIYCILTCLLYFSPLTSMITASIMPVYNKKAA